MIGERRIGDMERGGEVRVPKKDIAEPSFGFGRGGDREFVLPGNREFVTGDRIPRPEGSGGRGNGSESGTGEGEDEFVFSLSREEFMEIFFDDLELPNLLRTEFGRSERKKSVRSGFTKAGTPANLAVVRTLTQSLARRIALSAGLGREGEALATEFALATAVGQADRAAVLYAELERLERRRRTLPYLEEVDLRYRNRVWRPEPIARAAMFCLMDVSASMDEDKKDLAKRFFTLLYLFLTRKYGEVDLIFIRHTDDAEEVDEDTFFHDTRTGGTVVLSALELSRDDPDGALRARLERLCGAGLRRRCLRRRSGQERALPSRAAAAGNALLHLPGARRSGDARACVVAVGRVRARRRGHGEFRNAPRHATRARSTRCSAACSARRRDERRRGAPGGGERGGTSMSVISHGADWDFELLERYDAAIGEVAAEHGLETYPNQIEIITSEQMIDAYATGGLPVGYPHWSYGKEFIRNEQAYRRGMQGLAYEIVINSNPCIAYLMEENTMATQALVIAHACYGHNSFFKGNHLFRQWTAADAILDYLVFARRYVMECEERHGPKRSRKFSTRATR